MILQHKKRNNYMLELSYADLVYDTFIANLALSFS